MWWNIFDSYWFILEVSFFRRELQMGWQGLVGVVIVSKIDFMCILWFQFVLEWFLLSFFEVMGYSFDFYGEQLYIQG